MQNLSTLDFGEAEEGFRETVNCFVVNKDEHKKEEPLRQAISLSEGERMMSKNF